jgi:hypothetical protein
MSDCKYSYAKDIEKNNVSETTVMVRYLSMMGFYGQYDYLKAAKSDTKMK